MSTKPKLTWPINLTAADRISVAKARLYKAKDLLSFAIAVRESNAQLVSARIRRQIPISRAANCYNFLVASQLRHEVVCLTALWDESREDRDSLPTILQLVSDSNVEAELLKIAENSYSGSSAYEKRRRKEERRRAIGQFSEVKKLIGVLPKNARFKKLRDFRNEVIAHTLSKPASNIRPNAIPKTKGFWDYTIKCLSLLDALIANSSMDWTGAEKIHRRNAALFWQSVSITLKK